MGKVGQCKIYLTLENKYWKMENQHCTTGKCHCKIKNKCIGRWKTAMGQSKAHNGQWKPTLDKGKLILDKRKLILDNIRKEKCRPATTTTPATVSRSGYPPWILKWSGLESSGRRLISSIGKTKRKGFFLGQKQYFKNFEIFWKKVFFLDFQILFYLYGQFLDFWGFLYGLFG